MITTTSASSKEKRENRSYSGQRRRQPRIDMTGIPFGHDGKKNGKVQCTEEAMQVLYISE